MEGLLILNIFDAKGIGYSVVIGFLILIISLWIVINRSLWLKEKAGKQPGGFSEKILRIPRGLFFSRYHTWTFMDSDGLAKIGADNLLMHITGEVQLKTILQKGDHIIQGDVLVFFLKDGKTLKLLSPISGTIEAFNTDVLLDRRLLTEDPYARGWIFRLKPDKWHEETRLCYLAEEAQTWMINELIRFREFILDSYGLNKTAQSQRILQEGGELTDFPLSEMPETVWQEFQKRFLT